MEIDVEPVEEIDDATVPSGVDAPEYVLYGGKGGVGKTTMAAATGLASARDGTATLVASTDPAHSLSDTLDTAVAGEPGRVRGDIPLYAVEVDPETADGGPLGGVAGETPFGGSGAGPGSDETAALGLLVEFFEDSRFDRVVVDTAPTGHTLRLLELPGRLDSMLDRLQQVGEQFGPLGGETPFGGFADRVERLHAALQDPDRTDFRIVTVPEELSIRESERMCDRLASVGIPVGTVVVNRVMQDPGEIAEFEGDPVAPDHTGCAFCERRWQIQQQALARAQDLFRDHRVLRVPLLAEEVRGERLLRIVAACLEA